MASMKRKHSSTAKSHSRKLQKRDHATSKHALTHHEQASKLTPKPFPFLQLPEKVRGRIYALVGLKRSCQIHLHDPKLGCRSTVEEQDGLSDLDEAEHRTRKKSGRYSRHWYNRNYCIQPSLNNLYGPCEYENGFCLCPPIQTSIFRVCRSIHTDVERFFYKNNRFRILQRLDLGIEVLQGLSSRALGSITALEVQLGHITNSDFRSRKGNHVLLLTLSNLISTSFTVSKLDLALECDISGLKAHAREMFMDVFAPMKSLGKCLISLESVNANTYFSRSKIASQRTYYGDVAQSLVAHMTSSGEREAEVKPFRYNDLPGEIRLGILEKTSLVIPDSDLAKGTGYTVKDGKIKLKMVCCNKCYRGRAPQTAQTCCCFGSKSVASSTCTCERSPKALFLVDKLMCQEAREVFLTRNRFTFIESPQSALMFLRSAPADVLPAMRYLDFSYLNWYQFFHSYYHSDHGNKVSDNFWRNWVQLVRLLQKRAKLNVLEISLHLPPHYSCVGGGANGHPRNRCLGNFDEKLKEIAPLLHGLKAFKLFSQCECTDEEAAEKALLGESYDSSKFGKLHRSVRYQRAPHVRRPSKVKVLA